MKSAPQSRGAFAGVSPQRLAAVMMVVMTMVTAVSLGLGRNACAGEDHERDGGEKHTAKIHRIPFRSTSDACFQFCMMPQNGRQNIHRTVKICCEYLR